MDPASALPLSEMLQPTTAVPANAPPTSRQPPFRLIGAPPGPAPPADAFPFPESERGDCFPSFRPSLLLSTNPRGYAHKPRPHPFGCGLGVGGEGGSSLFVGSAGARVEATELLKVFHSYGPSWRELAAWRVPAPNAGSAPARESGVPRPARGALSGGLPAPGHPSR